jgi:NTE family protein
MIRLGLALGGGGARGLAHVGVLAALEEAGLRPACIAGTSMGAIVGALYAERPEAAVVAQRLWAYLEDPAFRASWAPFVRDDDSLERQGFFSEIWRSIQRRILTLKTFTSPAQQDAERLLAPLRQLYARERIEELSLPFAALAVDLYGGEPVAFTRGDLVSAIYASSAIPGVFPPLARGETLLADGGAPCRVPIGACRDLGADFVLAVDIPIFAPERPEYRTGLELMLRCDGIARERLNRLVLEEADFVVRPDVQEFHWANFGAAERIRAAGEEAMRAALPALRQRLRERASLRHRVERGLRRWLGGRA